MKSVEIIMIPVKNREKAKEFYQKLGFEVLVEAPMPEGSVWLQMGLPNTETTISLSDFQGIIFETDNIEAEIESLNTKGIDVGIVDETPWGKFAWMKDLDENSLCLHQK